VQDMAMRVIHQGRIVQGSQSAGHLPCKNVDLGELRHSCYRTGNRIR
jgi:hypothetical protein